jgi:hypothetical protein
MILTSISNLVLVEHRSRKKKRKDGTIWKIETERLREERKMKGKELDVYVCVRIECLKRTNSFNLTCLRLVVSKNKSASNFYRMLLALNRRKKKPTKNNEKMIDIVTKLMSIVKRIVLFPLRRSCYFVFTKSPEN